MAEPTVQHDDTVEVFQAERLGSVPHGFLGRRGGVSTGLVAGLDMGTRAMDPADPRLAPVLENRRRGISAVLPEARLVTVYQVHGANCVEAGEWSDAERPHADALITDQPGVLLGILTADCAPVLLADRATGVVGAAHAGWKGALGGVIEATVAAMERLGARRPDIIAAVGPCIAQSSYEVDSAFRKRFLAESAQYDAYFAPGEPGHFQFDLTHFVGHRLIEAQVATVEHLQRDTYAEADQFFSFRRATHRSEPDYGRQISLIGLA